MRTLLALLLLLMCTTLAAQSPSAAPPIEVESAPLSALLQGLSRSAPAQVRARHETALSAEVNGQIRVVHVDTGDAIRAGAVLVTLDDRDARLALAQAEAQREAAVARLSLAHVRADRGQRLGAKQFISADELKALQTEVQIAKADVDLAAVTVRQARRTLEKTVLKAPYALVVRERMAQAGQQVAPGQPLLAVVASESPEVSARLEGSQLSGFNGATPEFVTGDQRFPLEVVRVSPVLTPATRTHEVRLAFPAASAPIGAEGRIEWRDRQGLLPAEYLSRRDGALGVFVLETGASPVARFVRLPAAEDGRPAAVDLPAETRVITRGRQQLRDGLPVRPATAAAAR